MAYSPKGQRTRVGSIFMPGLRSFDTPLFSFPGTKGKRKRDFVLDRTEPSI